MLFLKEENSFDFRDTSAISIRNNGIDLLRIISMIMICLLHTLLFGGVLSKYTPESYPGSLIWFLECACYCAVDCYALISGFVGFRKKVKCSSIIRLWLQVVFYSVIITLGGKFFACNTIGIKTIIKSFFPTINTTYWYFTAYFALFFFIPLLNESINSFSFKHLSLMCTILITVFSVFPTIAMDFDLFRLNSGCSALWLIILYLLGGFLGKYYSQIMSFISRKVLIILFLVLVLLSFLSLYFMPKIGLTFNCLLQYNAFPIMLSSIALLLFFSSIRINNEKAKTIITKIGSLTFGVYLIHVHPLVLQNVFPYLIPERIFKSVFFVPLVIMIAFAVFIVSAAIDYCRSLLFQKLKTNSLYQKIDYLSHHFEK